MLPSLVPHKRGHSPGQLSYQWPHQQWSCSESAMEQLGRQPGGIGLNNMVAEQSPSVKVNTC
eukprot:4371837-Amphidinium_carterae.1